MTSQTLRIATRESQLALWQAEHVATGLRLHHPGLQVELVGMTTQGDQILDSPLARIGGKGLFVKELEQALLEGRADIAVHSMKDVPVDLPEGLVIDTILEREDPRDALVGGACRALDQLPRGARVGTSSLRRAAQLRALRPDLVILDLRGNVNTRLRKFDEGQYDAIILACAGLKRLDMAGRISAEIEPNVLLPAIGQGAIGIERRLDDPQTAALLAPLNHAATAIRVAAERAMNARLEGGCQVPIAGHAELGHGVVVLRGLVAAVDGGEVIDGVISGRPEDAAELGQVLAEDLLARGADRLLAALRAAAD